MALLAARRLELLVVAGVVIADQIVKAMIRGRLALHDSLELLPGWLSLTRVHNTGAAFGMLNAADFPFKGLVVLLFAAAALGGVAWFASGIPLRDRVARTGVAAVLGGAVGNLIDRATYGYVLDFVDASWRGWHFWAFNVADAAITVGVIFLLLDALRAQPDQESRASHPA